MAAGSFGSEPSRPTTPTKGCACHTTSIGIVPDALQRIALFPENPRLCKYATRHFADDDALGLVEGFLRVVRELNELGDATEDWALRGRWLEELISELWRHRGLLPGMPAVLEVLSLHDAIPLFKQRALEGRELETRDGTVRLRGREGRAIPGSGWMLSALRAYDDSGSCGLTMGSVCFAM